MMTLREVSRYFDRVPCYDPLTGDELFRGQFINYDGSRRDAFTAYRRVLSVDPDVPIPPARCIRALGKVWVMGIDSVDGQYQAHRRKFVLQPAHGEAQVWSLAGYLDSVAPVQTWGSIEWLIDRSEEGESSEKPAYHVAVLPQHVVMQPTDVVKVGGRILLAQAVSLAPSGFIEARGFLQADAASLVTIQRKTFVPGTGGYAAASQSRVPALRLRWQELFRYESQTDLRYQEGDDVFALPLSANMQMECELHYQGRRFLPLALREISGVCAVHARPA